MSYKTDRLVELFPDAFAARETQSLLHRLLDSLGAELMGADAAVKRLLKSHWVDYADGAALDGLGAAFGVERRLLRDGSVEPDDAFRARLRSVVQLFTGGGTVLAIQRAVRSALGLPYAFAALNLPPALQRDLEALVRIDEFSPTGERVIGTHVTTVEGASEMVLVVDLPTVSRERPHVRWTFTEGGGRLLRLERLDSGEGVHADESFVIPAGSTLVLSPLEGGRLSALLDGDDVSHLFTSLDGSPPVLPEVPIERSEWRFRARSGVFDISSFDGADTFDLPRFQVEMSWLRFQPLTFDVTVPYFLQSVVTDLIARHRYPGEVFVFQGLPPEAIQDVVDQTRAAGVHGRVQFSLNFLESHDARERVPALLGDYRFHESADAADRLTVGAINLLADTHDTDEHFAVGGTFDFSTFDTGHGFI